MKVCLIGATTAKSLFGENVDPVGQIIRIKNAPFTIVGWLDAKGSGSFGQVGARTSVVICTA